MDNTPQACLFLVDRVCALLGSEASLRVNVLFLTLTLTSAFTFASTPSYALYNRIHPTQCEWEAFTSVSVEGENSCKRWDDLPLPFHLHPLPEASSRTPPHPFLSHMPAQPWKHLHARVC
jgi:hypothetical protein